jgi:nitric oxide reductase subunit C
MKDSKWWASEKLWRNAAVSVTSVMLVVLIVLTFDTMAQTQAGTARVPAYDVINKRISYEPGPEGRQVPAIGDAAPLFGVALSDIQAEELVTLGKKVIQGRNCVNCHTLLGNGAYYAPDLTKSWLDPGWGSEQAREQLMLSFLLDPTNNARTFGTGRRMPNLHLTEEEARGVIAFLKWMAAIDTNGFPYNFKSIAQGG